MTEACALKAHSPQNQVSLSLLVAYSVVLQGHITAEFCALRTTSQVPFSSFIFKQMQIFCTADIFKTGQLTPKQPRWINGAAAQTKKKLLWG